MEERKKNLKCVECSASFAENNTFCKLCGNIQDIYSNSENGILVMDFILSKNQAYRHLIFNHPIYQKYFQLFIWIFLFAFCLCDTIQEYKNFNFLMPKPKYYTPRSNQCTKNEFLQEFYIQFSCLDPNFSSKFLRTKFLKSFISILLEVAIQLLIIKIIYRKEIKNQKGIISNQLIVFALIISFSIKLGQLVYLIWKAQDIFIVLYLYQKAHNVTAIRGNYLLIKLNEFLALFEKNHFVIPICIVIVSIFCHFFLLQFVQQEFAQFGIIL